MERNQAVAVLDALSEETRLGVVEMLVAAGPDGLPAGVIADRLGRLPASLTFHLQHLGSAGLISCRREGRRIFYRAETARIADLAEYLSSNCVRNISTAGAGLSDRTGDIQQWFWR